MGRIDFIEINEALCEVYIKDDFGIYIHIRLCFVRYEIYGE